MPRRLTRSAIDAWVHGAADRSGAAVLWQGIACSVAGGRKVLPAPPPGGGPVTAAGAGRDGQPVARSRCTTRPGGRVVIVALRYFLYREGREHSAEHRPIPLARRAADHQAAADAHPVAAFRPSGGVLAAVRNRVGRAAGRSGRAARCAMRYGRLNIRRLAVPAIAARASLGICCHVPAGEHAADHRVRRTPGIEGLAGAWAAALHMPDQPVQLLRSDAGEPRSRSSLSRATSLFTSAPTAVANPKPLTDQAGGSGSVWMLILI